VRIVILSLSFILPIVAANYCLARSIGLVIPPLLLLVYLPLIVLLVDIPISIAGIGVRENVYIFVFSTLGFRTDDIVAFGLSNSALIVVVYLSGGIILLLRSGLSFFQAK
jgi:hypothetical protein